MMLVDGHDAVTGQDFVAIFGPHCCAALVLDDGPTTVEPFLWVVILISELSVMCASDGKIWRVKLQVS